jgi:hypothetical protein
MSGLIVILVAFVVSQVKVVDSPSRIVDGVKPNRVILGGFTEVDEVCGVCGMLLPFVSLFDWQAVNVENIMSKQVTKVVFVTGIFMTSTLK